MTITIKIETPETSAGATYTREIKVLVEEALTPMLPYMESITVTAE